MYLPLWINDKYKLCVVCYVILINHYSMKGVPKCFMMVTTMINDNQTVKPQMMKIRHPLIRKLLQLTLLVGAVSSF